MKPSCKFSVSCDIDIPALTWYSFKSIYILYINFQGDKARIPSLFDLDYVIYRYIVIIYRYN